LSRRQSRKFIAHPVTFFSTVGSFRRTGEQAMRYMMLVYTKETASSREKMNEAAEMHHAVMEETSRRGILLGADPLQSVATATTVRVHDGKVLITDGPFAETKEQLAGYYILDCKDLDEAIQWASRIPTDCGGGTGCIEVRPIQEITNHI
jgi:hypothetical protein